MATTPISGTFTRGGAAVEGLRAKTAAGEVTVSRRVLGVDNSGHPLAGRATGTGAAYGAVVSTPNNTITNAGRAAGVGAASNATAVGPLGANAGRAIGVGTALAATVSVPALANAGRATGIGAAGNPSIDNGSTGPLSPPLGTRFSTGTDLYLLDGPLTAPAGAVTVTAGVDALDTVTAGNAAGTTFYLTAGRHTLGTSQFDQVQVKAGNTYIGAPGAILDGQFLNAYAFTGNISGVTVRYLEICNFVCPFDEFVVNHDTGDNWTVEYCNIHSNSGAGVGVGNGTVLQYSWVHHNRQYGFSAFNDPVNNATTPAITNVTVDHCEIHHNGDQLDEFTPDGSMTFFGRNGGCKFWDTRGMTVTSNWIHHSNFVGVWADTNNIDMHLEGNLIEDIWGEGFFYEISYNFLVLSNTFRRCGIGKGMRGNYAGDNFPRPALYISESGSESRVSSASNSLSEIRFNKFINNWDDITLWENPDRFCNSPANTSAKIWKPLGGAASLAVCNNPTPRTLTVTLTSGSPNFTVTSGTFVTTDEGEFVSGTGIPAGTKILEGLTTNSFASGYLDATHGVLTANATASGTVTMTIAAGSITGSPGNYDCRWHTQHIHIHNNAFDHHRSDVLGVNNTLQSGIATGKMCLISNYGTFPAWSPYTATTIQTAITFNQDNLWSVNTYRGNYSSWVPFDTGTSKTFTQWQAAPYGQDSGSTLNTTPPTGNGGGTYYKPGAPTSVTGTAGPASVRVAFVPPADPGGGDIVGYTVTASPGGANATAATGPITVTGLTNTTAYTFTVVARNTVGNSVASTASSSVTPTSGSTLASTTKPWHPRYPTARKRTATTAEVSFVQPASTGGSAITGYTVTSSPGAVTATGTTGPITVTGLSPSTAYTFTVTATNAVGVGPASPATSSITLDALMVVGVGTGVGTARTAPLKASTAAGAAAGTGTAQQPAVIPKPAPATAFGTVAAQPASGSVSVAAGSASGTGAARAATAEINGGYGTSGYGSGGYGV